MMRRILLICGILSSLLYAAMTVFIAMQWPGYSSVTQTVSELSAIGAPTRSVWVVSAAFYTLLVTAFGWGVWQSAGRNRPLAIAGQLILVYGALGLVWPLAPMHLRETLAAGGGTVTDTLHLTLGAVTVLLMLAALSVGATALGQRFRVYSIASLFVLAVFGALTFVDALAVGQNLPTPLIGVWERINIGAFLLWVVVLAVVLLRDGHPVTADDRAPHQRAAFKSPRGQAAFLAAYDAAMKSWPVAYQDLEIESRFGTTHVVVSGPADAPPLVLLHGYWSTLTMWTPNVADLSRDYRVFAIDVMGQPGRSMPREPIRTAADLVTWLTATLDGLRLNRVALVGMSYGGWLALTYALASPARVQKLVLLSPAASFMPIVRQFSVRGMLMMLLPSRVTVNSFMRWLGFVDGLFASGSEQSADTMRELMYLGAKHFRVPREAAGVTPTVYSDHELQGMHVPTLLLIGTREVIFDPSAALARARRLLPDVEGDLVPRSSHEMCARQHYLVDRRILAFLKPAGIRRETAAPDRVMA